VGQAVPLKLDQYCSDGSGDVMSQAYSLYAGILWAGEQRAEGGRQKEVSTSCYVEVCLDKVIRPSFDSNVEGEVSVLRT
jgi:hypothetical protein